MLLACLSSPPSPCRNRKTGTSAAKAAEAYSLYVVAKATTHKASCHIFVGGPLRGEISQAEEKGLQPLKFPDEQKCRESQKAQAFRLVFEAQRADLVQKRLVGDSQLFGGAGFIPL